MLDTAFVKGHHAQCRECGRFLNEWFTDTCDVTGAAFMWCATTVGGCGALSPWRWHEEFRSEREKKADA